MLDVQAIKICDDDWFIFSSNAFAGSSFLMLFSVIYSYQFEIVTADCWEMYKSIFTFFFLFRLNQLIIEKN